MILSDFLKQRISTKIVSLSRYLKNGDIEAAKEYVIHMDGYIDAVFDMIFFDKEVKR